MKISLEKNDVFNIFAQNIDCGYTLKPPRSDKRSFLKRKKVKNAILHLHILQSKGHKCKAKSGSSKQMFFEDFRGVFYGRKANLR